MQQFALVPPFNTHTHTHNTHAADVLLSHSPPPQPPHSPHPKSLHGSQRELSVR